MGAEFIPLHSSYTFYTVLGACGSPYEAIVYENPEVSKKDCKKGNQRNQRNQGLHKFSLFSLISSIALISFPKKLEYTSDFTSITPSHTPAHSQKFL
jgi:hypothetical protein